MRKLQPMQRFISVLAALAIGVSIPALARAAEGDGFVSAASDGHGTISLAWIVKPELFTHTTFRVSEIRSSGSTLVATVHQGDALAGVSPRDLSAARSLATSFSAQKSSDRPRIGGIIAMKLISDPAFARAAGFGAIVKSDRGGSRHYRIETDGGIAFESAAIDSQIATPLPPAPLGFAAANTEGGVALTWDPPARGGPVPIAAYTVERVRDGTATPLTVAPLVTGIMWKKGHTLLVDRTAPSGAALTYRVRGRDALGRESAAASTTFEPVDIHALRPIALGAKLMEGAVALSWKPRADPQTGGYLIERASMLGGPYQSLTPGTSIAANVGNYIDRTPSVGNAPYYRIRVVSPRGDLGIPSPAVVAGVVVGSAPDAPANARAEAGRSRVHLSWSAASGSRVSGYFVERSGGFNSAWTRLNSVLTPFNDFNDAIGTHAAGTLQYRIIAVGNDERRSLPSAIASVELADQRPPADVSIVATTSKAGVVTIAFRPATNGSAANHFIVYRASAPLATLKPLDANLAASARSVDDATELAGTRVWYRVAGFDSAGRRGRLSVAVAASVSYATLPAAAAPSASYEPGRPAKVRLHFAKAPANTLLTIQVLAASKHWRTLYAGVSEDTNALDVGVKPGVAQYRIASVSASGKTGPWSTPARVTIPAP